MLLPWSAMLSIVWRNINAAKLRKMDSRFVAISIRYVLMYRNMMPSSARAE